MKFLAKQLIVFGAWYFLIFLMPSFCEIKSKKMEIENYLNAIQTLEADIIQISSNGAVETGTLKIKKPGKMRFEYDPPARHLVMASGILFVIIDKKSTAEPQRYLTAQTPIGYLLDENINLNENSALKDISIKGAHTNLSFYDHDNPAAGQLEVVFSQEPLILKEWTITNYSGEKTRVLLEKLIINKPISKKLFNIGHEISKLKKQIQ